MYKMWVCISSPRCISDVNPPLRKKKEKVDFIIQQHRLPLHTERKILILKARSRYKG